MGVFSFKTTDVWRRGILTILLASVLTSLSCVKISVEAPMKSKPLKVFEERVIRVASGNTILILYKGERAFCYEGIVSPDPNQLFGREAMDVNKRLVERNLARVECPTDLLNRSLKDNSAVPSRVYVKRSGMEDLFVNAAMVAEGYAIPADPGVSEAISFGEALLQAEKKAIEDGKGFWGSRPELDEAERMIASKSFMDARNRLETFLNTWSVEDIPAVLDRPLLPHIGRAHLLWVEAMKGSGEVAKADARLKDLFVFAEKKPSLWLPLARYFHRAGSLDRALSCYMNYRQVDPNNLESLRAVANVAYKLKKWNTASETYKLLSEREPLSFEEKQNAANCPVAMEELTALLEKATAAKSQGDVRGALEILKLAADKGGNWFMEYNSLRASVDQEVRGVATGKCEEVYGQALAAFDNGEISMCLSILAQVSADADASCKDKTDKLYRNCTELKSSWMMIRDKDDPREYQKYVLGNPPKEYAELAKQRIDMVGKERSAWDVALRRNSVDGFEAFRQQYPNSQFESEALRRIIDLKVVRITQLRFAPMPLIVEDQSAIDSKEPVLKVTNHRTQPISIYVSGPVTLQDTVEPLMSVEIKLVAGSYKVGAVVYETGFPPMYGQFSFVKNGYGLTFEQGPPPFVAP